MPKRISILFIFITSFIFCLNAEVINGNCSISDKPFGENLFQLNPGTIVDCSAPQKGWCMVLYKAFIDKKYVYEGIKIKTNAHIRNEKGKNIGRVFADMNPYRMILENDTCFIMEIAGFIEASCIEDTSVVEHELEKIYFKKDTLLDFNMFAKHFSEFNYSKWISKDKMQSYLLKETDIINPKPGLRVIIIFDNNKAIAILHRRTLKIKSYESAENTERYNLIYLGHFNEAYKKRIADTFLSAVDSIY